ncbi:MAG: ATP-binding protein [Calditrichaeota bacterium]|nr:MAG: ATP-binding protein [Calditrichota bacterium]
MMDENLQQFRLLTNSLPDTEKRTVILITGARQTGKTTLAKTKYPHLRYINLDSPENRELIRYISSSSWPTDVGNAIIDEAQKEPLAFDKIKFAFDAGDISFQVILGSSQILLLKKIRESLAGRISIYELWPLMMKELYYKANSKMIQPAIVDELFNGASLDQVLAKKPSVLFAEDQFHKKKIENYLLQWGGMPALLPLSDAERTKWLRDYEYTYLERDLADLARLDDLIPFRKLQKLSALRSSQLLNYSEIARDSMLSVDTAKRYLEYLTLSYQVILLQPYYRNLTSSVVKTPKLYWLDIGLLRTLTGSWSELSGSIFETMIVSELVKWLRTVQKQVDVYFYRTRSGLELDLLLQTQNGIIGVEIKSRAQVVPSDITAMKQIAGVLGKEWRGGLVIYRGEQILKLAEPDIWAVPSFRLFL